MHLLCELNVSVLIALKTHSVNGILGCIDSPIPNRFSDKVIDWLSSGANGIQQVDLGRADY